MKVCEIVEATNGVLVSGDLQTDITGFIQDSRNIRAGDMYIPIIGERLDGHDFIAAAFDNGASAIITSKEVSYPSKIVIKVEDTVFALQQMAMYLRQHRNVKVVGITGSVGKTSTKDMVYSVLCKKYKTIKTLGNYNNEIGLPLTILRLQEEEVLVLEMGMNHLQEMSLLSKIAKPDIAVITNVGTAHIGELGSRKNILKAKLEIIDGMQEGATLIINGDNDMLANVSIPNLKTIKVGIDGKQLQYQGENVSLMDTGSVFTVVLDGKEYQVEVCIQGKHFVLNALLALAIGRELEISNEDCIAGIKEFELTKNRMDTITLKDNIIVIDGTYNASEDSMKSSLDVLANYQRRRIAVLADMLEMGSFSKELHMSVGKYVAKKHIDIFICVGTEAKYMYEAATQQGMKEVLYCNDNQEVIDCLSTLLKPQDVVLLKGSNGMHLKDVVTYLKENIS